MSFTFMKNSRVHSLTSVSKPDPVYCLIYGGVLICLLVGLIRVAKLPDIATFMLYVASFSFTAYLLFKKSPVLNLKFIDKLPVSRWLLYPLIITAFVIPLIQWIHLGGVPLLQALNTLDYLQTVLIRQAIYENESKVMRYAISINVMSILPFLALILLVKRSSWFWPLALFALVYGASLMQKSYAIAIVLPSVIYAFEIRDVKKALLLSLSSFIAVVLVMLATNPSSRPTVEIFSPAFAATVEERGNTQTRQAWTAYGERFDGKFSSGGFHFTGKNALYLRRSGSEWEFERSDFSLEFWMFPLDRPTPGNFSVLYWNGAENGDWRGASRITYGTREDGIPYIEFNLMDRLGKFSLAIYSKGEVKLNQWNHIYVARSGGTSYLGLNGVISRSTGSVANLSSDGNNEIVQFGAQNGKEYRDVNTFFHGYIDQIRLLRGSVNYTSDYLPDRTSTSAKSLNLADVSAFEVAPKAIKGAPPWLFEIMPNWLTGLIHRVLFVPGEVVGYWFAVIPSDLPFANGCGYRPLAFLLRCKHINFSQEVYIKYNQYLLEKGVNGSMNVASFMEDYANFGMPGLAGSGIVHALLLYLVGALFAGRRKIGIAINTAPLLYLSSSGLFPLLLSGGWMVTILLYMIFQHEFGSEMENKVCAV